MRQRGRREVSEFSRPGCRDFVEAGRSSARGAPGRRSFRGRGAATSLKRRVPLRCRAAPRRFRGRGAATSLKPGVIQLALTSTSEFSRPGCRDFVEAAAWPASLPAAVAFSRPGCRDFVEAHDASRPGPPPDRSFRGRGAATSLKPRLCPHCKVPLVKFSRPGCRDFVEARPARSVAASVASFSRPGCRDFVEASGNFILVNGVRTVFAAGVPRLR